MLVCSKEIVRTPQESARFAEGNDSAALFRPRFLHNGNSP